MALDQIAEVIKTVIKRIRQSDSLGVTNWEVIGTILVAEIMAMVGENELPTVIVVTNSLPKAGEPCSGYMCVFLERADGFKLEACRFQPNSRQGELFQFLARPENLNRGFNGRELTSALGQSWSNEKLRSTAWALARVLPVFKRPLNFKGDLYRLAVKGVRWEEGS